MNEKSHIPHPFEIFGVECHKGWFELLKPIFSYVQEYNRDKEKEKQRKSINMEELLFSKTLDGESLVKDILNTDGVSSITDEEGKSYWWNTIDKTKKYQIRK